MSKFPHERARELYQMDEGPDAQEGSSSEGVGWAGLYIMDDAEDVREFGARYIVLTESTDGFVDYYRCQTREQADAILSEYAL